MINSFETGANLAYRRFECERAAAEARQIQRLRRDARESCPRPPLAVGGRLLALVERRLRAFVAAVAWSHPVGAARP